MYDTKIFWQWFEAHNEALVMLNDQSDEDKQQLLDEMQTQLEEYCPGLTYIMSEATSNGRKITFSAEGDSNLFRYVVELTESAPDLDWWEFVSFKQPAGAGLRVRFDQYLFDTSKMHFMQLECEEEPDFMGLLIGLDLKQVADGKTVPSIDDEDLQVGIYSTIEEMIGEFDCATLLGYLDVCPLPEEPFKAGFRPLDDLPEFVEWFKKQRDRED